jgi:2-polyprenyl-3-methyl-5-hydroxy-6-metoxy-1,4-benzoquinol methylase
MSTPHRYAYHFNPEDLSTAARALRLVGHGKRVLELGTAAGSMTEVMQRHYGCRVVGVELDPEAAEQARPYCERLLIADLDTLDWPAAFSGERFDVVLAADVLEHLRDPWACLRAAREHLLPEGALVISVPNVTHSALLAQLLMGRFPYTDKGLLDRTHLRFFSRADLEDLLLATGFLPLVWERIEQAAVYTELAGAWWALPQPLREYLARQPDGATYQFVVKAVAGTELGALAKLRSELAALRAERDQLAGRREAEEAEAHAVSARQEQAQGALRAEALAHQEELLKAFQDADRSFKEYRDAYHRERERSASLELRLGQQAEALARQAEVAARLEAETGRLTEQVRHPRLLIGAAMRARLRRWFGGEPRR